MICLSGHSREADVIDYKKIVLIKNEFQIRYFYRASELPKTQKESIG